MPQLSSGRRFNFESTSPSTAAKYDACYQYRWCMIVGGSVLMVVGSLLLLGIISQFKIDDSSNNNGTITINRISTTVQTKLDGHEKGDEKGIGLPWMTILFGVGFFLLLICGCILCGCGMRVRAYRMYKEQHIVNGSNALYHPGAVDNEFVTPLQSQYQQQYPAAGYGGYPASPSHYGPTTQPGMAQGSYPGQRRGPP